MKVVEEIPLKIGQALIQSGKLIMPVSFVAYLLVRWLEHFWGWKTSYAVGAKAAWYLLAGMLTFEGNFYVGTIVGYICFIEAWDLFLTFRKGSLERKQKYKYSKTI